MQKYRIAKNIVYLKWFVLPLIIIMGYYRSKLTS